MTKIVSTRIIYEGWLTLSIATMRAASGDLLDRHVIGLGRAVCVLPYDPMRRTALVVSMPRAPVTLVGLPDMMEAIAGSLANEEPEDCARREAMEEGGVRLSILHHVGRIWPMPSNATEEIDYYLAPYSAQDLTGTGGGLTEEQENITVHEVKLSTLWNRYRSKNLLDGKLVTLVLALKIEQPDIWE